MIAAKKLIMAGRAPKPFNLSGSFETGLDGWVAKGMTRRDYSPRTGQWAMSARRSNFNLDAMEYTISKTLTRGLNIAFRINANSNGVGGQARLQASYDGGATFAPFPASNTFTLASGPGWVGLGLSFTPPREVDVLIRLSAEAGDATFDDWTITGTRA